MEQFHLQITNFEGPLDLLLELVKAKQMDLLAIDLVELAAAYVALIDKMKHDNIDLASEYLVMAVTLLNLKAKILIQNPSNQEEVDQARESLLSQLIEYNKFKTITKGLRILEARRTKIFLKPALDYEKYHEIESDNKLINGTMSIEALVRALAFMLERVNALPSKVTIINHTNVNPLERRTEILALLSNKKVVTFEEMFRLPTIQHFAVTMLTILDMARQHELVIHQLNQFDSMTFSKKEELHE